MPPGPAREKALERLLAVLRDRASRLERSAESLRDLVLAHDPVVLIASISVPASMGMVGVRDVDDAPATVTWDAKIEYLHGIALSGEPGTAVVTEDVTDEAIARLGDVYDAANARMLIEALKEDRSERDGVDQVSFKLRNEALVDRMAGYACHLERIDAAIFDPHRAFYLDRLGFCPSDAVRLVRRHVVATNRRLHDAPGGIGAVSDAMLDDETKTQAIREWQRALEMAYLWTAGDLAETTGLAESAIAALLDHLAVRFGCQREFRTPFDPNVARTRPLVTLDGDEYFVPLPWTVAHNVHMFMQHEAEMDPTFATRYQAHRASGAARLVHASLASVFGAEHAHAGQYFVAREGPGEVDSLVVGTRAVVAEVKSQALTDLARRGHRPRIERVADDAIDKALSQTGRAADYILAEGGRAFAERQGGAPVERLPTEVEQCFEIVVTLERMDPLATHSLQLAGRSRPAWVTGLADFLMVIEILDDPATLLDYIEIRSQLASLGVEVIMESDALEGYLVDRLVSIMREAHAADDNTTVVLGYGSSALNRYFTSIETGLECEKPTREIPSPVLSALSTTYDLTSDWSRAARAVVAAEPGVWKAWRRFKRRHRTPRRFVLPGCDVGLLPVAKTTTAGLDGSTLTVPRSE